MDGKIPLPEMQFDSERVRYEHRLLPFSSLLTPPPVHYQEFLDMTNAQMHKRNVSLILNQIFKPCVLKINEQLINCIKNKLHFLFL